MPKQSVQNLLHLIRTNRISGGSRTLRAGLCLIAFLPLAASSAQADQTQIAMVRPPAPYRMFRFEARPLYFHAPVLTARLASPFSLSRRHPLSGRRKPHWGIDLAAPSGTAVFAAEDGIVSGKGYSKTAGLWIAIRHRNDFLSKYFHLKSTSAWIDTGSTVRRGAVIGRVGTTGRSTGPHLHFELHKAGRPVDPFSQHVPSPRSWEGKARVQVQGKFTNRVW